MLDHILLHGRFFGLGKIIAYWNHSLAWACAVRFRPGSSCAWFHLILTKPALYQIWELSVDLDLNLCITEPRSRPTWVPFVVDTFCSKTGTCTQNAVICSNPLKTLFARQLRHTNIWEDWGRFVSMRMRHCRAFAMYCCSFSVTSSFFGYFNF